MKIFILYFILIIFLTISFWILEKPGEAQLDRAALAGLVHKNTLNEKKKGEDLVSEISGRLDEANGAAIKEKERAVNLAKDLLAEQEKNKGLAQKVVGLEQKIKQLEESEKELKAKLTKTEE